MPSHHAHVRTRGTVSIPCSAQRSCAKLLTQYSRLLAARQGSFYAPTVISGATTDMKIFREETFGPAIPLFKFAQDEEAVQLANNTEYGLAAYFFTKVSTPNLLALPSSQIVKGGRRCSWPISPSLAWQPTCSPR